MSDQRPARVRVTGPRHGRARRRTPLSAGREIDEETEVGQIFLRSLLRSQLRLAAGVLTALGLTVLAVPLLGLLLPAVAGADVLGMPLSWSLLAFGVYPVILGLGVFFVRRAERIEDAFADVIERP